MPTYPASPARNPLCPLTKFTSGLDLSGQSGNAPYQSPFREEAGSAWGGVSESPAGLHGAGGIGGLLAMVDTKGTSTEADDGHLIYFHDANGNIGQVMDVRPTSAYCGQAVAKYEYYPFGGNLSLRSVPGEALDCSRSEVRGLRPAEHLADRKAWILPANQRFEVPYQAAGDASVRSGQVEERVASP